MLSCLNIICKSSSFPLTPNTSWLPLGAGSPHRNTVGTRSSARLSTSTAQNSARRPSVIRSKRSHALRQLTSRACLHEYGGYRTPRSQEPSGSEKGDGSAAVVASWVPTGASCTMASSSHADEVASATYNLFTTLCIRLQQHHAIVLVCCNLENQAHRRGLEALQHNKFLKPSNTSRLVHSVSIWPFDLAARAAISELQFQLFTNIDSTHYQFCADVLQIVVATETSSSSLSFYFES